MVFGRKLEASDEGTGPLKTPQTASYHRSTASFAKSQIWHGTGRGQHLHQRWLH